MVAKTDHQSLDKRLLMRKSDLNTDDLGAIPHMKCRDGMVQVAGEGDRPYRGSDVDTDIDKFLLSS
jgi:hypothetical protein